MLQHIIQHNVMQCSSIQQYQNYREKKERSR